MQLVDIIRENGNLESKSVNLDNQILRGITCDSRQVEPGYLFAALPGTRIDGRQFIQDAIKRGAIAVLGPPGIGDESIGGDLPIITDVDPRRLYAIMAARFFQKQPKTIAAITGTSGKTSCAHFLRQIWNKLGVGGASLGTMGLTAISADGTSLRTGRVETLTTPDASDLHLQLRDLVQLGIENVAVEASSHGLDQRRLDGVRVTEAAFTNITHDHLDYHGSETAYLDAKLRLFEKLLIEGGSVIINADQNHAEHIAEIALRRGSPIIRYGACGDRVRLLSLERRSEGQSLSLDVDGVRFELLLPLLGVFQASNVLCALSLALAGGFNARDLMRVLPSLNGVPGRMEWVGKNSAGANIYVDYAHKPDALKAILLALRLNVDGDIAVVFGCGGDRDADKRTIMGSIAGRYADKIVVTDDNPRSENAAQIRKSIIRGCPNALEIGNREEAIGTAFEMVGAGDALVIAGKGHKTGQNVDGKIFEFDDASVVRGLIGNKT